MKLLALFAVVVPSVALAQPGTTTTTTTTTTTAPPPAPYPPPPPPYQPPPPQPVYQPYALPPAPPSLHNGLTVELNLGVGYLSWSTDGGTTENSDAGVGGLDLGVGGWINENMALSVRAAGVSLKDGDATGVSLFLGPSLQYWINNNLWLGGGAGLARLAILDGGAMEVAGISGFGLDLRAGFTFSPPTTENTFNVSLELTPGFYSDNGSSATLTGVALLFGYQHL